MRINFKDILFVSIQFLLFFLYILDIKCTFNFFSWINHLGLIASIIGFAIILLALLQLNKNLSPFPTPKNNSVLIQNGLYKYVRHPIYSGIILLFLGFGFYNDSLFKLLISLLLTVLFYFKTNYEEKRLLQKFPNYAQYKMKVGRFFMKFCVKE